MAPASDNTIEGLIHGIEDRDELAVKHKAQALEWLQQTTDIYRRAKPRTPSPHLVSYFLPVDRKSRHMLLCDHRLSGLWLPPGGHVEPGEHPADTVRREAMEELGVEATFDDLYGSRPFFLTVTETVGSPADRHTDVSLWFALAGRRDQPLTPDEREFVEVRWWRPAELAAADRGRFEPHLLRALDVLAIESR